MKSIRILKPMSLSLDGLSIQKFEAGEIAHTTDSTAELLVSSKRAEYANPVKQSAPENKAIESAPENKAKPGAKK